LAHGTRVVVIIREPSTYIRRKNPSTKIIRITT
jgi:hypothetical protein